MNRFYLVDKPIWITSFDVIRQLRRKLGIKKMWHTGTLDPLATGMLFVATGNYTKLIPFFEKDVKTYTVKIALNGVTDSYDCETPINFLPKEKQNFFSQTLKFEDIQIMLEQAFLGTFFQLPPAYSAVKIDGKKALELVRAGKNVEMKPRSVTIFSCQILSYEYPSLELEVTVSAGTYIRSLAHDLWQKLGTGWYVTELRRTKIGNIDSQYAQNLEDFDEKNIVPLEHVLPHDMCIKLSEEEKKELDFWRKISAHGVYEEWKKYFVVQGENCTHVVKYEAWEFIPERKI